MSKVCEICNKGYQKGNLVPRGIGKRVTRRTTVRKLPNLFSKRIVIDGTAKRYTICSSCIKRIKFETAKLEKALTAEKVKVTA